MGKTTVSSSTFSNVAKSSYKPKLKSTKFQFKSPFQKQKAEKAEGLKTQIQGSAVTANVAATLGETNRILVEIQQQLALDFANRIAEKKQLLELSRRTALKQKAVKKEAFVERGIDRKKVSILNTRVLAPVKGIFDKIIDFLSILGTGIALNSAWNWLSKKENRDKLIKIFQFLKTYWKQILGGVIIAKAIGAITKLVGLVRTLRKIFKRLRGLRGQGGKGKGPKPGSPDFCAGVTKCIKDGIGGIARALATSALFIQLLKPKLGLPTGTPAGQPAGQPVAPGGKPLSTQDGATIDEIFEEWQKNYKPADAPITFPGTDIPLPTFADERRREEEFFKNTGLPRWSIPLIEAVISAIAMGVGKGRGGLRMPRMQRPMQRPQINLGSSTSSPISPVARKTGADFNVTDTRPPGVNLDTGASSPLTRFPRGPEISTTTPAPKIRRSPLETIEGGPKRTTTKTTTSTRPEGVTSAEYKQFGIDISIRAKQFKDNPSIYNVSTGANRMSTKRRLLDIYNGRNPEYQTLTDKASARRILNTDPKNGGFGMNLPEIQPGANPRSLGRQLSEGVTSFTNVPQKRSQGGTIFGQGSQSVDSVPAMLAPGEEVIRSSAANLFRPLLKDINDNAGRMWTALSNAIGLQKRNNEEQDQVNAKFTDLIDSFNKDIENLIQEKKLERFKNIGGGNGYRGGFGPRNETKNAVKPKPKSSPTSIKTYNVRKQSSNNGQPTIVNMPMPAMNLAGNQSPEAPNTNVQETSSTPISISSFDSSNPYIAESLADYGIFV